MKNRQIPGIMAILIIGLLLTSGCTSSPPAGTTATPTPTMAEATPSTVIPATLPLTPATTSVIPVTTAATTTTQASYTASDVNRHFIEIAFGPDYSTIHKWNKQIVTVGITGAYTDDDVKVLNDFFKLFNSYSGYTKLPSEAKQSDNALIVLNFLPESSIKNINSDNSWKISRNRETDRINYIYKTSVFGFGGNIETIYINSDLKGNARTHWVLRSLLYELGFPGETGTYPDSIFFADSETATSLSRIDLKALELMYGSKITNGMSLAQVKQLLLIDNT